MTHIQNYYTKVEATGKHGLKSPAVVKVGNKLFYTKTSIRKTPLEIYENTSTGEVFVNVADLAIAGTGVIGTSRVGRKL